MSVTITLGAQAVASAVRSFGSVGGADGPISRLFVLPDSLGALVMTYYPDTGLPSFEGDGLSAGDIVNACRVGHQAGARWFGGLRPRTVAARHDVGQYASDAAATCRALAASLHQQAGDAAAGQDAQRQLNGLQARARQLAADCGALAADMGALSNQIDAIVARVVAVDQQINLWRTPDETEQRKLEEGIAHGVCSALQSLEGAWGALADDLQAAAVIIVQDIERAPQAIVDLGFAEAAVQWQQLAAEVAAMGDAGLGDQGFAPRSLGWRRAEVSDADDLYLRFDMQVAPDGGVGMGPTGASPVTTERLTGDQAGYVRIRFDSTGKYLSAEGGSLSAGARLRASDWVDGDYQKWRPIRANQASVRVQGATNVVTISGWFLVQRSSGLLATAQPQQRLSLAPATGSLIPLLQTTADGHGGDNLGFAVFQIAQ